MTKEEIRKSTIVQHFKRETLTVEEQRGCKYLYTIVGIAIHTETEEELVIYKAMYGEGTTYARPINMFLSEVDHIKYPYIQQKHRFEVFDIESL